MYNLTVKPLAGPVLLTSTGDLKAVCAEAAALLPGMANYVKVRRQMLRADGAWSSIELHESGRVLVTIIWTDIPVDLYATRLENRETAD